MKTKPAFRVVQLLWVLS